MDAQQLTPERASPSLVIDQLPPATRKWWRTRLRITLRGATFALVSALTAYLVLVPLGTLIAASFQSNFLGDHSSWTVDTFARALGGSSFLTSLAHSLEFAGLSTIFATVIGMALAFAYVRTNIPAKPLILLISAVPLIIPGLIDTAAWVLLLAAHTGPVNTVLASLGLPQISTFSMLTMVFVQTLHSIPVSFLLGIAIVGSMDRSLEEAGAAAGARPSRVLRSITLPVIRQGTLGSALLVFVLAMALFEVPQLIGVPAHEWVLTTQMYNATTQFPVDYGTVAVLGIVILCITVAGLLLSRTIGGRQVATVTGKGFRPSPIDLGRWRWGALSLVIIYGLIAVALPLAALVWTSLLPIYENPSADALGRLNLDNYRKIFDTPQLVGIIENTIEIAFITAAVTTLICFIIGYMLTKTDIRGRRILEVLSSIPIALPSVILGVALLYWYLVAPLPVQIYGTKTILVIAFVTSLLPFGLRFAEPALAQISSELEEAAATSGARTLRTFTAIYAPLLRTALGASFIFCFILSFKELTSALFLYSHNSEVLSVYIYSLWLGGSYPEVCALGIFMIVVLTVAVLIVGQATGRQRGQGRRRGMLAAARFATGGTPVAGAADANVNQPTKQMGGRT